MAIPSPTVHTQKEQKDGTTFQQKFLCSACTQTWVACGTSDEKFAQMATAAAQLEDARRQIATLRLLVAKDRRGTATQSTGNLKVFRAAG